nr:phage major capsid protein [uncultured Ruegeria sp.]
MRPSDKYAPGLSDKAKRQFDSKAENAIMAAAWETMQADLAEGEEARRELPDVKAEVAALRKALERPQAVTATIKPPEEPKAVAKRPRAVETVAAAATAEVLRRERQIPVLKTLNDLFPGSEGKIQRSVAKNFLVKSATAPGGTTVAGWGAELVETGIGEWVDALTPVSVFGAMMSNGGRNLPMGNNMSLTMPNRPQIDPEKVAASFVVENGTIPVKQGAFGSVTAYRTKAAVISVFSGELANTSAPEISDLLRSMIIADTAEMLDGVLLDPTMGPVSGIRSGSPWFGATTQASAGTGLDNVIADIAWLQAQITGRRVRRPAIIIDNLREQRLRMMRESGVFLFRDEVESGSLFGMPLIVSATVPTDKVYIIDLDDFSAWSPPPIVDVDGYTTVVMADDDPASQPAMEDENAIDADGSIHVSDAAGTTPATKVVSTFQSYSIALRMVQPLSWVMLREGTAAYVSGVAW